MATAREYLQSIAVSAVNLQKWSDEKLEIFSKDLHELDMVLSSISDALEDPRLD